MLKRHSFIKILWVLGLCILLIACGDSESSENKETDQEGKEADQESEENQKEPEPDSDTAENSEDESENNDSLPEAIPSDFPFPDKASFTINELEISGAINYVVAFSTSDDPEEIYKTYREYVTNKGYNISHEEEDNLRLQSMNDSLEGIGVEISDMGSVKVVTVTFTIPSE